MIYGYREKPVFNHIKNYHYTLLGVHLTMEMLCKDYNYFPVNVTDKGRAAAFDIHLPFMLLYQNVIDEEYS